MEEIWKDIQGYEGLYQVSNQGNVKSLHFGTKYHHPNWQNQEDKLLRPKLATSGYYRVELYKPGSRKCLYIHRLVAIAFIPNPEGKTEVNHIDGNKLNNSVDNLEWASRSENQRHAIKLGLRKSSPMAGRTGAKNPNSKQVIQYDLDGNFVKLWECSADAAKAFNKKHPAIKDCANYRYKTSLGYIWRFKIGDTIPMKIDTNEPTTY